jgi:hypothetical protein
VGAAYHIPDEPRPGGLAEYTVNPFWPLLAMMLGGSWVGLPWFVVNGKAMGSAGFRREALVAALTPVLAIALAFAGSIVIYNLDLPKRAFAYSAVLILAVKLGCAYWLYLSQQRSFGIYQHFGGRVRQGALIAIGGAVARMYVVDAAFKVSDWLGVAVM